MNLAAIDIGSNGARLLICRVLQKKQKPSLKDTEFVRFPLRLGKDVFEKQLISPKKIEEFIDLMQAYKLLMKLHKVDDSMALATSALREARNGQEVLRKIKRLVGIEISIISGEEEAEFTHYIINQYIKPEYNYLHIDVGGGSTELNCYINENKTISNSFDVGAIRSLQQKSTQLALSEMENFIIKNITPFTHNHGLCIGTGGNINKIFKILNKKPEKPILLEEIRSARNYVAAYSMEDRIHKLGLNPDRAETIIPAADIYLRAMEIAKIQYMIVPQVGLRDGMMQRLVERNLFKLPFHVESSPMRDR